MNNRETFQLIFEGNRCGVHKELPIKEHLALLKFSDTASSKLASGRLITVKRNLSYEDAVLQQQKFESLGLVTFIKLELNADLFKLGLKNISEQHEYEPSKNTNQENSLTSSDINTNPSLTIESDSDQHTPKTSGKIHIVDQRSTIPILFSTPGNYPIKSESNRTLINLKTHSYSVRGFLLIAASAGIGIILQSYILAVLLNFGLPNILTSIVSIIFLLLCVAGLPKIFQPLQYCELTLKGEAIKLIDEFNIMMSKHHIIWETADSEDSISLNSKSASAYNNNQSYHWDAQLKTEYTGETAIEDIQELIIEETIIGTVLTFFDQLKTGLGLLSSKKNKNINWQDIESTYITDQDNQIVALIYNAPKQAYRIVESKHSNDLLLHAFCLSIHRNRMV